MRASGFAQEQIIRIPREQARVIDAATSDSVPPGESSSDMFVYVTCSQ